VLLAGIVPLFLGVLLSDIAYGWTYEVQWKNIASWLIVGGLVFGGLSLLWAELFGRGQRESRSAIYAILLLTIWILGFINALVHAKDAWASMPEAIVLSVIIAALAIAALWFRFATRRDME